MNKFRTGLLSGLIALCGTSVAQEALPEPPPVTDVDPAVSTAPAQSEQDVGLEPDVTIREGKQETVYEYRRGGTLVMVRIQPKKGPAYYFYDKNGDGELEMHNKLPGDINVNQWMLMQW